MPIVLMKGNAVVAIPAVKDVLFGVAWNRMCLMEWALRVMSFMCGVEVKRLEINYAAGLAMAHTTMWWHHVMGPPTITVSRTPSNTSWSSPALTSSCQWSGTGIGV